MTDGVDAVAVAVEEAYKQQMIDLSQQDKFDLNDFYDHLKVSATEEEECCYWWSWNNSLECWCRVAVLEKR